MAVFRKPKTKDYTIMSNHHLRNTNLSLKAKGLLSLMLSLPDEWDYTTKGLTKICKDGADSISSAIRELEDNGYLIRTRIRNSKGQLTTIEYTILEQPDTEKPKQENPVQDNPVQDNPIQEKPEQGNPIQENRQQLNTNISNTKLLKKDLLNTECINYPSINQKSCCEAHQNEQPEFKSETEKSNDRWIDRYYKNINHIKNQINYDSLIVSEDKSIVDEIVNVMAEVLTLDNPYYTIEGNKYSADIVKDRFLQVDYTKICAFFIKFNQYREKIKNVKSYLITSIFNMPATSDTMMSNMVRCGTGGDSY